MARYRTGVAYHAGGEFMSTAIQDAETGMIFPMGDQTILEEVCRCLNDGMPNPLLAGIMLTFKTFEEATDVGGA
jgi:hypothetical protein